MYFISQLIFSIFSLWGTNDPEVVIQQTTVTFWPRLALVTVPTYFFSLAGNTI
jgi:hypothetical protein